MFESDKSLLPRSRKAVQVDTGNECTGQVLHTCGGSGREVHEALLRWEEAECSKAAGA